jgi:hypothetical protein
LTLCWGLPGVVTVGKAVVLNVGSEVGVTVSFGNVTQIVGRINCAFEFTALIKSIKNYVL